MKKILIFTVILCFGLILALKANSSKDTVKAVCDDIEKGGVCLEFLSKHSMDKTMDEITYAQSRCDFRKGKYLEGQNNCPSEKKLKTKTVKRTGQCYHGSKNDVAVIHYYSHWFKKKDAENFCSGLPGKIKFIPESD